MHVLNDFPSMLYVILTVFNLYIMKFTGLFSSFFCSVFKEGKRLDQQIQN